MAFIVTRINVGDYDTWKSLFDQDVPQTRASALNHRVLRNVADPNEVYVLVEFASVDDAQVGADRLVASGVRLPVPRRTPGTSPRPGPRPHGPNCGLARTSFAPTRYSPRRPRCVAGRTGRPVTDNNPLVRKG